MAIVTARTFTVADLLVEFEDTRQQEGRAFCPIVKKLTQMGDTWTVEDFEDWIFAQPYNVEYVIDVIRTAGTHHPPDLTANFQAAYAKQLTNYPWERVRPGLEKLLYGDVTQGIAPEAMTILTDYIRDNHPNAKNFLSHPEILAKIPPDVDITDFPCVDFPELAKQELVGARCEDVSEAKEQVWVQLTTDPKVQADDAQISQKQ